MGFLRPRREHTSVRSPRRCTGSTLGSAIATVGSASGQRLSPLTSPRVKSIHQRYIVQCHGQDTKIILRNEEGQCILRQTTLTLRYPIYAQRLTHANQADPRRPVFEHE